MGFFSHGKRSFVTRTNLVNYKKKNEIKLEHFLPTEAYYYRTRRIINVILLKQWGNKFADYVRDKYHELMNLQFDSGVRRIEYFFNIYIYTR